MTGRIAAVLTDALRQVADALRPWTIDFHVAQNDGTVKGSGSHDKTGRHCPPDDPNGKMDIVQVAGLWMRDERWHSDASLRTYLLGRLHVPQRDDDLARYLGEDSGNHDPGARCARLGLTARRRYAVSKSKRTECRDRRLRIHGPHAFQCVPAGPALFRSALSPGTEGGLCAQSLDRVKGFAENWGYQSVETDWRALVARNDIDLIDIASPNDTHAEIAIAAAKAGKMVLCEKPLGRTAEEARAMVDAVESAERAQHGLVQLPARSRRDAAEAAAR